MPRWVKGECPPGQVQWETGRSGNPAGRKPRETERAYLAAFKEAVPYERWVQIVERAASDAVDGDHKAREWLAQYIVGKPLDTAVEHAPPIQVIAPPEAKSLDDWFKAAGAERRNGGSARNAGDAA